MGHRWRRLLGRRRLCQSLTNLTQAVVGMLGVICRISRSSPGSTKTLARTLCVPRAFNAQVQGPSKVPLKSGGASDATIKPLHFVQGAGGALPCHKGDPVYLYRSAYEWGVSPTAVCEHYRPSGQQCVQSHENGPNGEVTGRDDVRYPYKGLTDASSGGALRSPPRLVRQTSGGLGVGASTPHVTQLNFSNLSATPRDPLAAAEGLDDGPGSAGIPPQVEVLSSAFGFPPSEVVVAQGKLRAVWCDPSLTEAERLAPGPHQMYRQLWGRPVYAVSYESGSWFLYEYQHPQLAQAVAALESHPHAVEFLKTPLPLLSFAADLLSGNPLGSTADMLHELDADPADNLRLSLLKQLRDHPAEMVRGAIADVGSTPHTTGFSVREQPENGSNGSHTGPDDVPSAKQRRRANKRREAVVQAIGDGVEAAVQSGMASAGLGKMAPQVGKFSRKVAKPIVSSIERVLHPVVKFFNGSGEYDVSAKTAHNAHRVSSNTLMAGGSGDSIVSCGGIMNCSFDKSGSREICSKDLLNPACTSSTAGVDFTCFPLYLNPGDARYFPCLSTECQGFSEYSMKGFALLYLSATSDSTYISSSTSASLPMIGFAVDRNVGAAVPKNWQDLSAREEFFGYKANKNALWFLECAKSSWARPNYLVRQNGMANDSSMVQASDFDCVVVWIGVQGVSATVANDMLGNIMAAAHVRASRMCISPARFGYAHFVRSSYDTTVNMMGSSETLNSGAGVRDGVLRGIVVTGNVMKLIGAPYGLVCWATFRWAGASPTASVAFPTLTWSNITPVSYQAKGTSYAEPTPLAGSAAAAMTYSLTFQVQGYLNTTPTLTFGGTPSFPTSVQQLEITVKAINIAPAYGLNI